MPSARAAAAALGAGGVCLLTAALLTRRSWSSSSSNTLAKLGAGYVQGRPVPVELASIGHGQSMRKDAAAAFNAMAAAANAAGHSLVPTRAFATLDQQARLFALYQAGTGNLAARPGYSNHQGGIAVDIAVGSNTSAVYQWLALNAARYGFVRTVRSEAWHWEYRPGAAAPAWQAPGAAEGLSGPIRPLRATRRPSGPIRRQEGRALAPHRLRVRRSASS